MTCWWYVDEIPDFRSLFSTDGAKNLSGYSSEEMDILMDNIMQQSTKEGLKNSFRSLQNLLIDDVPVISLYFRTNTLLTRAGIVNVTDSKDDNAYNTIQDWNVLD